MPRSGHMVLPPSLAAAMLVAGAAVCDEWPQFRRDGQRSAYSRDRIPTRVIDLWDWEESSAASAAPNAVLAHSTRPFTQCAIWNGRLFVVSMENKRPFLICADAKSGLRIWQQPLGGWGGCRPEVGPAVTRSGIVYAYDRVQLTESQAHIKQEQLPQSKDPRKRQKLAVPVSLPASHLRLRAFDAATGRPLADHPMPAAWPRRQFNPLITRLYLNGGGALTTALLPGRGSHWGLMDHPGLGPALVVGNQLQAAAAADWVVRWSPGALAEIIRITDHHNTHPAPWDLPTPASLQGFPLVQAGDGTIVADDRGRRFLGLLGSGPREEIVDTGTGHFSRTGSGTTLRWQFDMLWTLGIPAATQDALVLGVGGKGAHGAIGVFEPQTGSPRWFYPGTPLPDKTMPLLDVRITPIVGGRALSPDEADGTWSYRPRVSAGLAPKPKRLHIDRDDWEVWIPRWESVSGQLENLGLVVAPDRIYGFADGGLVGLDAKDGRLLWRREQFRGTAPIGFIGTRDHLVVLQNNGPKKPPLLLGISRKDGKLAWSSRLPAPGQLVTAYSLIYLCQDGRLTALAPAERTYLMAIDSDRAEDYLAKPPTAPEPEEEGDLAQAPGDKPDEEKPGEKQPDEEKPAEEKPRALRPEDPSDDPNAPVVEHAGEGDATLVRLRWGVPLPQLRAEVEARRRLVPHARMVLVLDWLDLAHRERVHATAPGGWSDGEIAEYARTCAELARLAQPDHFEVASDVNVYLALHPGQVERVRKLVRVARTAVAAVSTGTRVTLSYNCEVLAGIYGRTHYFPFGDLPEIKRADRQAALSLVEEVEEVALTTRPQSGFIQPRQMGPNYYLARRQELGNKPVLITRVEARLDETDAALPTQEQFMKRVLRLFYWLDARVVAYPDLHPSGKGSGPDVALQVGAVRRPAMTHWKETLGWRWVQRLTADVPPPR